MNARRFADSSTSSAVSQMRHIMHFVALYVAAKVEHSYVLQMNILLEVQIRARICARLGRQQVLQSYFLVPLSNSINMEVTIHGDNTIYVHPLCDSNQG